MNIEFGKHSFPNLFIYYGGGGIECCSAVQTCLNEMMFQSFQGILKFFPVWNKKKNASFYNLRGYGAFLTTGTCQDGIVKDITIYSEKAMPCTVLCPWESGMTVFMDNMPVEVKTIITEEGVLYSFSTNENQMYTLIQT